MEPKSKEKSTCQPIGVVCDVFMGRTGTEPFCIGLAAVCLEALLPSLLENKRNSSSSALCVL